MQYDIFKKRNNLKKPVVTCDHLWKLKTDEKTHIHRCIRFRGHLTNHKCICGSRPRQCS